MDNSIQEFLKYITDNPFLGKQEECGTGKNYWNADMWTLEVAACLFLGKEYKNNNKRIFADAKIKGLLSDILTEIKDDADSLLVCEVGRGLDILVANMVKKWKKIYCYDHVNYKNYLKFENIQFHHQSTYSFNPDVISEKSIMIMNHSIYRKLDKFRTNNIIHAIVDGELKW